PLALQPVYLLLPSTTLFRSRFIVATPLTSWTGGRLAAHHGEPCHAYGHGTGRTYGGSRVDVHHGRRGYAHVQQMRHVADGSARTVRPGDPRQRCSGS